MTQRDEETVLTWTDRELLRERDTEPPTLPYSEPPPDDAARDGIVRSSAHESRFRDAPPWAIEVVDEMRQAREELSTAMAEFGGAAQEMTNELRGIRTNQDALKRSFELFRDESRTRGRAFEDELGELRGRVDALESHDRELIPARELVADLRLLRERVGELERARRIAEDDGK